MKTVDILDRLKNYFSEFKLRKYDCIVNTRGLIVQVQSENPC